MHGLVQKCVTQQVLPTRVMDALPSRAHLPDPLVELERRDMQV